MLQLRNCVICLYNPYYSSSIAIAIKILLIDDIPCILGWIVKCLNTQDNIQLPKAKNNIPVQCGMLSFVYGEVILNVDTWKS